jgi:two-component system, OmpR family, sensor histidine kinase VicK
MDEPVRGFPYPLAPSSEGLRATEEPLSFRRRDDPELFDGPPDGSLVTGLLGTIQEASRTVEVLLRTEGSALRGQPLGRFVVPADRMRFEIHLIRLRLGMERRRGGWGVWLQPLAGTPFLAALTASGVRSAAGHIVGFRWLIRDITRQEWSERDHLLRLGAGVIDGTETLVHAQNVR